MKENEIENSKIFISLLLERHHIKQNPLNNKMGVHNSNPLPDTILPFMDDLNAS